MHAIDCRIYAFLCKNTKYQKKRIGFNSKYMGSAIVTRPHRLIMDMLNVCNTLDQYNRLIHYHNNTKYLVIRNQRQHVLTHQNHFQLSNRQKQLLIALCLEFL